MAVDVDLILILEGLPPDSVSLDEQELEGDAQIPGVFDLGELAPDTTYTIEVAWPDASERLSFTTAADGRHVEDAPSLALRAMEEGACADWECDIPAACNDIAYRDSCFDTGLPVFQQFTVEGSALAYAVETLREDDGGRDVALIPASCGAPRVLTWGMDDDNRSYRVHALGADGSKVSSELIQGPDALAGDGDGDGDADGDAADGAGATSGEAGAAGAGDPPKREADGGCSLTPSGRSRMPGGSALLLLLALVTRRRHATTRLRG